MHVELLRPGDSIARWSAYSYGSRKGPCARCFGLGVRRCRAGIRVCECAAWGVKFERLQAIREARRRLRALSSVELPGESRRRGGSWGMPIVEARIDAWWAIARLKRDQIRVAGDAAVVAGSAGVVEAADGGIKQIGSGQGIEDIHTHIVTPIT